MDIASPTVTPTSSATGLRDSNAPAPDAKGRLTYLPIGLFGAIMGMTGLSLAWRLAHKIYGVPKWITEMIAVIALISFAVLFVGYMVKLVTAPKTVLAEFRHPIAGSLFGTFLISLLLTPMIMAPAYAPLARTVWVVGALGVLVFAWLMLSRWMGQRQLLANATPAWLVPVVGVLNLPLALPGLGWQSSQAVMVVGLAIGLFFVVPIFTLVLSRMVFEPPIDEGHKASLMILVAPFAVGFSAYLTTTGHVDLFAQALYVLMLFILAVVMGQLGHMLNYAGFRLNWWAAAFPLAACAVAALRFAENAPNPLKDVLAVSLLLAATTVIAALLIRTLIGVVRGELRTLSG